MIVAKHTFSDSVGGRFCTDCGMPWRSLVERREEWEPGATGFVCSSDRGLYTYEVAELQEAYDREVEAVGKAFGW